MIKTTGTRFGLAGFILVSATVHLLFLIPSLGETHIISDQSFPSMAVALLQPRPVAETSVQKHEAISHTKSSNTSPVPTKPQALAQQTSSNKPQQASAEIQQQIHTRLAEHFSYPLLARRNGYQGIVIINVRIKSNGQLENIFVARSSGYGILDRSALAALLKVQKLENIEQWLQGKDLDMTLPVRYQLNEG